MRPLQRLRELPAFEYNRGLSLLDEGRFEECLPGLYAALRQGADAGRTRLAIGKALWGMGRTEDASAEWRRAAEAGVSAAAVLLQQVERDGTAPAPVVSGVPATPRPASARSRQLVGPALIVSVAVVAFTIGTLRSGARPGVTALPSAADANDVSRPAAEVSTSTDSRAVLANTPLERPPVPSASELKRAQREATLATWSKALGQLAEVRPGTTGTQAQVAFAEGLFAGNSDELSKTVEARIREVAQILARSEEPATITVRGFTAPGGAANDDDRQDDWYLAFRRASKVVLEMRKQAPNWLWKAVGQDDVAPPFALTAQRGRNRTVVLEVAFAQ